MIDPLVMSTLVEKDNQDSSVRVECRPIWRKSSTFRVDLSVPGLVFKRDIKLIYARKASRKVTQTQTKLMIS